MARPKKQPDANPEGASASSSTTPTPEASPARGPQAAAEAFTKIEPELAAIGADELAPLEVDVAAAVSAALAAVPRIREHREAIVEQLPQHPIEPLDKLETYALAAWYAHLAHTYASTSPEAGKAMIEEAQRLREGLLIAAEALAHRGLLDADAVARIRKGSGHADTAGDLSALGALFASSWGRVSSKTAVERTEIDRALELGPAVMVAITVKKHGVKGDSGELRSRAFALLAQAYESCRRALAYLRWKEGDLDAIAPSLTRKKPGRKPKKAETETAEAETAEAETAES
jgi:hypothetical protein